VLSKLTRAVMTILIAQRATVPCDNIAGAIPQGKKWQAETSSGCAQVNNNVDA
jgi:hypothetical protein